MSVNEVLIWARGTGLSLALALFIFGMLLRTFEIFSLGRKPDLSVARVRSPGSGWRTVMSRSTSSRGMWLVRPVTYVGGYLFHLTLFAVLFLCVPHISVFRGLLGVSWPGLPSRIVDVLTVISLLSLLALLFSRLNDPVKRFLSGAGDYLAWVLCFVPLLSGYLAYNHLLFDYPSLLAFHILAAELLMALLPFTRLFHAVSAIAARWYNGDYYGRRGIAS